MPKNKKRSLIKILRFISNQNFRLITFHASFIEKLIFKIDNLLLNFFKASLKKNFEQNSSNFTSILTCNVRSSYYETLPVIFEQNI